ncbi:MAG: DNA polymerase III subunit delta, partial [Duncaniella sp.]|nr:DNA polymerase III subunit delta [Duncaniella sp.]
PFHDTIFLLVSDDAASILPTIYSRCRPIEMQRLSDSTVAEILERRAAMDPADALALAHIAEGDVNRALRSLDATSTSRMFFDYFITLMRRAYQRDVKELKKWANDIAGLGREQQLKFYDYAQRLIRENFIYNFALPQLNYLTTEEQKFSRNFARFISENNAEKIISAMNQAQEDIAGNANGKIVNFDFAIKMIIYIKNF